ncbi:MAG: DUF3168 domain-containing protein [Planctomycetia bacterium]|nr:DUF3168 domain-containing protein [Planctomycetia bacterium]
MSLEQAVHTRWAGDAALVALVPAARFFSGPALGEPARPYATLHRLGLSSVTRTSSRTVNDVLLRLQVWSLDLPTAKQIADAIAARFDGQTFASDGVSVLRMRRAGHVETRQEDGTWEVKLEYTAKVEGD